MNHEGKVRLVIAHAQGGGGYKALQLVRQQGLLQAFAFNVVNVRVIGIGVTTVLLQPSRHALSISGGEDVHNAAARQRWDAFSQPGQAVGRTGHLHDLQGQTVAHERAALHLDVVTQLRAHIALHPVVRCGGGGQHRNVVGQPLQHLADASIVRAKVVPPVRNAVRLVHHQHANARGNRLQHTGHKLVVGQPLGRNQEQVRTVCEQLAANRIPVVGVG